MTFYHDRQSNMLIYPDVDQQAAVFAEQYAGGIRFNGTHLAVEATLTNMQKLRLLKLPVIPPVTDDVYDWPLHGFDENGNPWTVKEHQKIMTNFMVLHPRSFNLSDMGTMKTLSALWAAEVVMKANPGQKALVVCPLSIVRLTWANAIFTHFMGRLRCKILHGTPAARIAGLQEDVDIYIINHDGVTVGIEKDAKNRLVIKENTVPYILKSRADISTIIIDEASAYRNGATRRSRVARAVFNDKPYVWTLTGSPTSNGPLDAHGIAKLVNGAFGEPFTVYKKRIMVQVSNFKWAPKQGAALEAYKLLQPSIRFQMRDCTDVPPCTEVTRDVALSSEQQEAYSRLKKDLVLMLSEGVRLTVPHEGALRLKLIQISCGAIYDGDHFTHFINCRPRLAELKAILNEAPAKVIVFAPLTSVVHMLYEQIRKWWKTDTEGTGCNQRFSCACLTGETKVRDRDEIIRNFQSEGAPNILVGNPGTMHHGLDLFVANVIVWYGPTDKPEVYLQANRRIDRPGQKIATTVVRLAATPVEREIYRRLSAKQSMQGLILDFAKGGENG